MTKEQKADRLESIKILRRMCRPGKTVFTTLAHVSRSGMMRHIRLLVASKGSVEDISFHVARALDYRMTDNHAVKVGGCGMDMGYHLVNSLSYCLHGMQSKGADAIAASGKGIGFTPRPGHYRSGYSLNHRWL